MKRVSFADFVAILALGAAGSALSYDALRQMAVAIHIRPTLSYLFPLLLDGFIGYGVRALVLLREAPFRARLYAWGLFGTATTASVWANALHAIRLNQEQAAQTSSNLLRLGNWTVGALSTLAPLALGGAVHLYIVIARHMRGEDKEDGPEPAKPNSSGATLSRLDGHDDSPAAEATAVRSAAIRPTRAELLATDQTKVILRKDTQGQSGPAQGSSGPVQAVGPAEDQSGPVREGGVGPVRAAGPAQGQPRPARGSSGPARGSSGPVRSDGRTEDRSDPVRTADTVGVPPGPVRATGPEDSGSGPVREGEALPATGRSGPAREGGVGPVRAAGPAGDQAGPDREAEPGPVRSDTPAGPVGPAQGQPRPVRAGGPEHSRSGPVQDPEFQALVSIGRKAAAEAGRLNRPIVVQAIRGTGRTISNERAGEVLRALQRGEPPPRGR
ncbi:DUF2637 domain-containing protein [Streptacidiphilus neutrinimicus]|uniref:DUF2637 domain-containing protein n=1 Tax=Streptacidiphilus neutrinimicus TaxID=105420 RepID=UPI000AA0C0CF